MKERGHSEDLGIDARIILEDFLLKLSRKLWTGYIWLRIGISGTLS
jgi:hypothetical protein